MFQHQFAAANADSTWRRLRIIRYKIIEFARPTISRNDALPAAPVERLVGAYKYGDVVRLMVFELTNDTADLTDAIKAIVDICAYRNSHILITNIARISRV